MAEKTVKKRSKIGKINSMGMLTFAAAIDGLQALISYVGVVVLGIVLNSVVSAFATTIFLIWFLVCGVNFISMKRMAIFGTTLIAEIVPVVNNFPMWTIGIAFIIASVNAEALLEGKKSNGSLSKINPLSKIASEVV